MQSHHDGLETHFGFHWHAPVVMVSSLLVGTGLAAGHHAFYSSLTGSAVSSNPINVVGWTTTQQQINIAIGTAFAFLVKASLILACSTAYMQLLFRAINRKSFKLSTLDNWFGGLNDLWSLGCLASYWRYPLVTLVALTCWLLPIAAIISPASLSVVFDQVHPSPVLNVIVPQPALDSMAFGTFYDLPDDNGSQRFSQMGPNNEVSRIAYAAAAAGNILSIDPPGVNATWNLDLDAPRFSCSPLEADVLRDVKSNLIDVFNNYTANGTWPHITNIMFSYLSWAAYANDTSPMPFKWRSATNGWTLQEGSTPYFLGVGVDLFLTIVPRAELSFLRGDENLADRPLNLSAVRKGDRAIAEDKAILIDWYFDTATTLRCRAIPTTYRLNFEYGGAHDQHVRIESATDAVEPDWNSTVFYTNGHSDQLSIFTDNERDTKNITSLAARALRLSSYSAIQQAMMNLLLGAGNSDSKAQGKARMMTDRGVMWTSQTQVFGTVLGSSTIEMHALGQGLSNGYNMTLNDSGTALDQAVSLLPSIPDRPRRPFKDALEELFFNITISMASSSMLTYNSTSPLAPTSTDVTLKIFTNVYSYGSDKLWLAYGIAIGVTTLNVLVGLWAIVQTGASFTANFSTIVRVAKNAVIEADMRETRLPGRDPLPKRLAKAEIQLLEGEGLLGMKRHESEESIQQVHVVGYAPPRLDSLGWR
ncbi:uncharacterized protein RCC_05900 [Ramularia collo-cygni]|uniref:Uncharacterized protein n=1 Tax=Ramularia collo-cygni TaxID=112498 RepID=A0A2D3VH39_9PEZI|nr:uncharacterized protein RCC_05900 [Ramularia collo-cygni]CZT20043.1 uncharacterized protein RCC_05900 [Ramularia collo-cygni]